MLSVLWNFAVFIVTLGVLITAHEFGHFWVARRCDVKVERFSIGFGKELWRCRDQQGTEYVLSLIPLGGYIKMLDERIDSVPSEFIHQSFNNKTFIQRAAIISAGPIANFIFAIFAYWLVFIIGVPGIRPVIGKIMSDSPTAKLQIAPNTELKAIDGIETPDWDTVRMVLAAKIGANKIVLTIAPYGSNQTSDKIVNLRNWQFEADKQDPVSALGIQPRIPQIESVLTQVKKNSAASKAGLKAGDRIVKVNGHPLERWQDFAATVRNHPREKIFLEVKRQSSIIDLTLIPDVNPHHKAEGFAGVIPNVVPLSDEYRTVRQYGPVSAIGEASMKTWQLMKLTVNMLWKLIVGDVSLDNLSGPISIAQGAGMSAEHGLVYYLMFLSLISVNLGIINLFPLPMLDGGHLLFLLIEKIKKEPVSKRVQGYSYRVGLIVLVLLMGLTIFNDFSKL